MKYTLDIEIKSPRNEVVKTLTNKNNLKHWQKDFVSIKLLYGERGKPGATSKLIYKMRKKEIEMIETITFFDPPKAFHLTFDTKNVYNIQENYFENLSNGNTKWTSINKFKFSGFMKIMSFLIPDSFKQQSYSYMNDFKIFVESGKSI